MHVLVECGIVFYKHSKKTLIKLGFVIKIELLQDIPKIIYFR